MTTTNSNLLMSRHLKCEQVQSVSCPIKNYLFLVVYFYNMRKKMLKTN